MITQNLLLAIVLAPGISLFETFGGGQHAYFDSAVTLLFFLLIGRYLDRRARGRAPARNIRRRGSRLLLRGFIPASAKCGCGTRP